MLGHDTGDDKAIFHNKRYGNFSDFSLCVN